MEASVAGPEWWWGGEEMRSEERSMALLRLRLLL